MLPFFIPNNLGNLIRTVDTKSGIFTIKTFSLRIKGPFEDQIYLQNPELVTILPRACSDLYLDNQLIAQIRGLPKFDGTSIIDEDDLPENTEEKTLTDYEKINRWNQEGVLETSFYEKVNGKFAICTLFIHNKTLMIFGGSKNKHLVTKFYQDQKEDENAQLADEILSALKKKLQKVAEPEKLIGRMIIAEYIDGKHLVYVIKPYLIFFDQTLPDPLLKVQEILPKIKGIPTVEQLQDIRKIRGIEGVVITYTNGKEIIRQKHKTNWYVILRSIRELMCRWKEIEDQKTTLITRLRQRIQDRSDKYLHLEQKDLDFWFDRADKFVKWFQNSKYEYHDIAFNGKYGMAKIWHEFETGSTEIGRTVLTGDPLQIEDQISIPTQIYQQPIMSAERFDADFDDIYETKSLYNIHRIKAGDIKKALAGDSFVARPLITPDEINETESLYNVYRIKAGDIKKALAGDSFVARPIIADEIVSPRMIHSVMDGFIAPREADTADEIGLFKPCVTFANKLEDIIEERTPASASPVPTESKIDVKDFLLTPEYFNTVILLAKQQRVNVIMSGIPGTGKSTVVKLLEQRLNEEKIEYNVFSTDTYFTVDGVYKFDGKKLGQNHKKNQEAFKQSLAQVRIVDNTNLTRAEYQKYLDDNVAIVLQTKLSDAETLFKRNVHGLSKEKLEEMSRKYEIIYPMYYGVFVGNEEVKKVLESNKLEVNQKTPLHITSYYLGGKKAETKFDLGREVKVDLTGYSVNDAGTCLLVFVDGINGNHVTLSTNPGKKPVDVGKEIKSSNSTIFKEFVQVKGVTGAFF